MAGLTILRVANNEMLAREEQARIDRELQARQSDPLILGLTAYLRTCWDAARIAKKPIEDVMLRAMRQRNGEYEPSRLAEIRRQGGSEIYMMVTEVKCRAAESWLRDIMMEQGIPPWDLHPTTEPDLPPDAMAEVDQMFVSRLMAILQDGAQAPTAEEMSQLREVVAQEYRFRVLQESQNRADKMRRRIEDQFEQGGWAEAFNDFITDLVTFPAAFVKGPVVRRQRVLRYETIGGKTVVSAAERLGPEFERVDPFRIYPEPGVRSLNDGYLFEHHQMSRMDLADLVGVPGYDDDAIRKALEDGTGRSWFSETTHEEEEQKRLYHAYNSPTDMFDALEFWGKVSGRMLLDWGLSDEEVSDPSKEYDANVWVVGDYVIKAVLNYDPLGEKPYAKTSFIRQPGAFWGKGIPEIIEDVQSVCNAAARALVNNMAIASGPQVEVNLERIPPNEDITQMFPWKIWQVMNDPLGSSAPAVRFQQPDSRAGELMAVYDRFSQMADDHSGIPAYIYGDVNVKGAGRTASGLSMLMGSAGKGIRQVVMHIDYDIVHAIVRRQFVYNMRYDPDESIKGDVHIVPKGAINLAVKETTNVRRVEFLNATANPVDIEILGPEGRAAILREVAKGLQMPVDDIIPSREKLAGMHRQMAQAQPAAPPQPGANSAAVHPDGSPMGGMQANTVMNRGTGAAA